MDIIQLRNKLKQILSLKNIVLILLFGYLAVFLIYPIYKAFVGSFHYWNPLSNTYKYLGLDNYKEVLTSQTFWKSIWNTLIFSVIAIFFRVVIGLGLALVLYSKILKSTSSFFRAVFYLPTITPLVAVSFVWMWLYNPQIGLINNVFGLTVNWLNNPSTALLSVIAMTIWKDFGYAIILFLAGLMSLPNECFEASSIDGASKLQQFKNITLPLLKPTTLFVIITSLITYLQSYIQILVMTEGGPGTSTYVISYLIFDEAFVKYNFGTASAMSVILFVIIAILTFITFKLSGERSVE